MIYKQIKEINVKGQNKKIAMYYVLCGNKRVYIKPTFTNSAKDWALLDAVSVYQKSIYENE